MLESLETLRNFEYSRIFARKKTYKTRTSRKVNSLLKITYHKYSNTAFISIGSSRTPSDVNVLVSRHSCQCSKEASSWAYVVPLVSTLIDILVSTYESLLSKMFSRVFFRFYKILNEFWMKFLNFRPRQKRDLSHKKFHGC